MAGDLEYHNNVMVVSDLDKNCLWHLGETFSFHVLAPKELLCFFSLLSRACLGFHFTWLQAIFTNFPALLHFLWTSWSVWLASAPRIFKTMAFPATLRWRGNPWMRLTGEFLEQKVWGGVLAVRSNELWIATSARHRLEQLSGPLAFHGVLPHSRESSKYSVFCRSVSKSIHEL